ncbi:GFA family protein [Lichenihabitans sp. Uapishka_5]|uniref:GFA family protein n=1 Tax=Lichenihabitans sp. Uapishka_5 TaxID=3037302 RepID=UPI0029E7D699|nr:GFA family protein [Lichenihabitans sp. Uapishka_5]MDX7953321.1 GFA family protein [Lichenihabitans sp. Uapishka_5]
MPAEKLRPRAGHLAGRCLCGRLSYQVEDAFDFAVNCHCSACRRTTGAAFKPIAGIPRHKLALRQGEADVFQYREATSFNVNCRTCGSFLYAVVRDGTYLHVAMGSLVDTPSIRPSAHIFVGSKAPWFTITDDLPQYEGFAPDT